MRSVRVPIEPLLLDDAHVALHSPWMADAPELLFRRLVVREAQHSAAVYCAHQLATTHAFIGLTLMGASATEGVCAAASMCVCVRVLCV